MLDIVINPNPILRQKSQLVADVASEEIRGLIPKMVETMMKKDGVGLAAPQIGQNIRLIVINYKDKPLIIINPEITSRSILKEWGEEGCLSVPDKVGEVKRHKKIKVSFIDPANQKQEIVAQGLLARIFLHEIDHLDGVLFIDKARKIKKL